MPTVLKIENLVKRFDSKPAVDDVSLTVDSGEVFGFLGPNGAGKTTTIRCLMDFLRPTTGAIKIFGLDSVTDGVAARRRIGYMPPTSSLNEKWTGQDHVDYISKLHRSKKRPTALAEQMELDLSRPVKQLSTGNKQKLSLALAFMHQAELIVLDEPTVGLDPLLQQIVYQLINQAHQQGTTIFMSSHNLAEVERLCTRVAILRQGKLVATEPMTALKDKHLYTIAIDFTRAHTFIPLPNISIISHQPNSVILKASGDLQPLLKQLAAAPIHDIQIQHATLEELFMEFYNRA